MKRMKRNEKWRGVFKHLAIFKLSAVVTNNLHERIGLAFVDVHELQVYIFLYGLIHTHKLQRDDVDFYVIEHLDVFWTQFLITETLYGQT